MIAKADHRGSVLAVATAIIASLVAPVLILGARRSLCLRRGFNLRPAGCVRLRVFTRGAAAPGFGLAVLALALVPVLAMAFAVVAALPVFGRGLVQYARVFTFKAGNGLAHQLL